MIVVFTGVERFFAGPVAKNAKLMGHRKMEVRAAVLVFGATFFIVSIHDAKVVSAQLKPIPMHCPAEWRTDGTVGASKEVYDIRDCPVGQLAPTNQAAPPNRAPVQRVDPQPKSPIGTSPLFEKPCSSGQVDPRFPNLCVKGYGTGFVSAFDKLLKSRQIEPTTVISP